MRASFFRIRPFAALCASSASFALMRSYIAITRSSFSTSARGSTANLSINARTVEGLSDGGAGSSRSTGRSLCSVSSRRLACAPRSQTAPQTLAAQPSIPPLIAATGACRVAAATNEGLVRFQKAMQRTRRILAQPVAQLVRHGPGRLIRHTEFALRRNLPDGLDRYLIRRAVECATITYDHQLKAGAIPTGASR